MSAAVDRHAATLSRDGWCVLARAVEPELIAAIEADLNPRFVATPMCQGGFYGEWTGRFGSIVTLSPAIVRLAMQPLGLAISEQMMLHGCEWIDLDRKRAVAGTRGV